MNSKINFILPIAVAVLLPIAGFFSSREINTQREYSFFFQWLITSIFLYILWHMLWYSSKINSKYKNWISVLIPIAFFGILYTGFYLNGHSPKISNFVRTSFATILIFIIQYTLRTQQNNATLLLEKEQLQTENYKTQLKAIRTQIDPHFLFNSLNTLRSMVRHHHSNSEKFIMSLSDFYRQTLKHNENTTLPLAEEIEVLKSYLFLMKSRNEDAILINIDIDEKLNDFHLPTLSLQVIVENCFKHNSMTSKMPLRIDIRNTNDFYIEVINNIQPKFGNKDESGYGLDLLKKRYELLNVEHGIMVEASENQFKAKLKLFRK